MMGRALVFELQPLAYARGSVGQRFRAASVRERDARRFGTATVRERMYV